MNSICNEDCFHCPYPDCVRDDLTAATYAELAMLEKTIINPPTLKQRESAAYQRAWYERNKEKVAVKNRLYYEAHREELAAKKRAYREVHREELANKQRAYLEAKKKESISSMYAYFMREYKKSTQRNGNSN